MLRLTNPKEQDGKAKDGEAKMSLGVPESMVGVERMVGHGAEGPKSPGRDHSARPPGTKRTRENRKTGLAPVKPLRRLSPPRPSLGEKEKFIVKT